MISLLCQRQNPFSMTYLARRLDNTQTPARQRLGDTQSTLKQRSALGVIMVYFRSSRIPDVNRGKQVLQ